MGGTKRKIPIEKLEKKEQRSVTFSKRHVGLFKKAAEVCLLCNSQIAILASPPSEKSNAFFYSFGHSSVDDVIDAYLQNRTPDVKVANSSMICLDDQLVIKTLKSGSQDDTGSRQDYGCLQSKKEDSGFWWMDEDFDKYEKLEDLRVVIKSMQKLKDNVMLRLNHKDNFCMSSDTKISALVSQSGGEDNTEFGFNYNHDFQIQDIINCDHGNNMMVQAGTGCGNKDTTEVTVRNSSCGNDFHDASVLGEIDFSFDGFDELLENTRSENCNYSIESKTESCGDSQLAVADSICKKSFTEGYVEGEFDPQVDDLFDESAMDKAQSSQDYQRKFQELASCLGTTEAPLQDYSFSY